MGTLRLTLLRHGEAQPLDSCPEDFERALTHRGTLAVQEMAARIARRNLLPDLILVSPAERTWTTAAIVAAACELDAKQIQGARELYLASPETLWTTLGRCKATAGHVLICGHNPGLSQLVSRLGPTRQNTDLPPAGLATALWHQGSWATIQPETASQCDLDDPDNMTDVWL